MNRLMTLSVIVALLPVACFGQYNQGITNVSVTPPTAAPGDVLNVQFDCSAYKYPEFSYVYWKIYLDDGTHYDLEGTLLASGQVYHSGDPWLQTFTISTTVTIPPDLTEEDFEETPTIKIVTCVHETIWTQVGYFAYYHVPIEITPPPVLTVGIDIKPGSYPNSINLGSNGVVPVAILSSETFDATQVDPETVILAGSGVAMRGKGNKYLAHEEDINDDGLLDLVCQVETENLDPGQFQDGYAILTGNLLEEFGGTPIEGSDEITIVPPE